MRFANEVLEKCFVEGCALRTLRKESDVSNPSTVVNNTQNKIKHREDEQRGADNEGRLGDRWQKYL